MYVAEDLKPTFDVLSKSLPHNAYALSKNQEKDQSSSVLKNCTLQSKMIVSI